ncbi:MAG: hypothetical protein M3125_01550, partial [Gemmatimonadota bacterium]|nr:hypothetical protein [Gemmatimonadota bacterium]
DHGVSTAVLETRADIPLEPEIDPSRDDNTRVGPHGAYRRQSGGVGRVRVHDPRARAADQSSQSERSDEIELPMRREPHYLDTLRCSAARQLILAARHDDRAVTAIAHPRRQPQDLTLATAPATLRIEVQDRQQAGVPREIIS